MTRNHLTILASLVASTALTLGAVVASAAEAGRKTQTGLWGTEEVPGPGDPDGAGSFTARLNPGQRQLCYELSVTDIDRATMAHVHRGETGIAGPVVVTLTPPSTGSSKGCARLTRALGNELLRYPGRFYVNVHNAVFPAGAVRGQLGD